jgi:hypothetical protein
VAAELGSVGRKRVQSIAVEKAEPVGDVDLITVRKCLRAPLGGERKQILGAQGELALVSKTVLGKRASLAREEGAGGGADGDKRPQRASNQ